MNQGPLTAAGFGAGPGGVSSAVLAALLSHFREEPLICPTAFPDEPKPDFYVGLLLGLLLGILLGTVLDLIYLARQHLTVSLMNRLASLTLARSRCG